MRVVQLKAIDNERDEMAAARCSVRWHRRLAVG